MHGILKMGNVLAQRLIFLLCGLLGSLVVSSLVLQGQSIEPGSVLLKDFILVFALNVVRVSCFFGFRQWFAVRGTDSFGI